MIFDAAWDLMKADIFHEGRAYSSMDDLMPLLNEQIYGWGKGKTKKEIKDSKKLSPFPFPYQSGVLQDKGWTDMKNIGLNSFIENNPGFTSSEQMLPPAMPWIGGKTGIQPRMRGLASFFPDARPAELYGGSGSTILGLNRGTGFFADINPDNTNLMTQLQRGMGVVEIPKSRERIREMLGDFNDLRYRRDVKGERLSDEELMRLAQLYVGIQTQSYGNIKYPENEKQRAKHQEWYDSPRYTEGPAKYSGWRSKPKPPYERIMPYEVGAIDLSAYPNRLRDVEIHTGDIRETAKLLQGDEFLYLDPQYVGRKIQYGGSKEQLEGGLYDQLQRDTIRIGGEHDGPVVYSNYMVNPQTGLPNYEMLDDLMNYDYDAHSWMRKTKGNKLPVVEVLALRNFPEHVQRASPNKTLMDF